MQRYEQFSEMSNELQNLQRELGIPIVVMAQLGRDAEGKRTDDCGSQGVRGIRAGRRPDLDSAPGARAVGR